jgi:lipopolysaccharide assembly outer membrane protein LptD (OstA)
MRLLLLCVAIVCQLSACASLSVCQQTRPETSPETSPETKAQPDRLHFLFAFPNGHNVVFNMQASSAERIPSNAEAGDVLQLRGNVELTMKACVGKECRKTPVVLHADGVDYNEKTGEIHTHGDVHIVLIDQVSNKAASK